MLCSPQRMLQLRMKTDMQTNHNGKCRYYILTLTPLKSFSTLHTDRYRLDQLKREERWQLTPSGRVAQRHRKEYVEETVKAHSLETVLYEILDDFREENGRAVCGHMFVLNKNTQRNDELQIGSRGSQRLSLAMTEITIPRLLWAYISGIVVK